MMKLSDFGSGVALTARPVQLQEWDAPVGD